MAKKQFKKKSAQIEALQFTVDNVEETLAFITNPKTVEGTGADMIIIIQNDKGTVTATINDWIVETQNNNFYPYNPNDFNKMYVEDKAK